jgi:hypothetical protein
MAFYRVVYTGGKNKILSLLSVACLNSEDTVLSEEAALAGITRQNRSLSLDGLVYARKKEAVAILIKLKEALAFAKGYRLAKRTKALQQDGKDLWNLSHAEISELRAINVDFDIVKV